MHCDFINWLHCVYCFLQIIFFVNQEIGFCNKLARNQLLINIYAQYINIDAESQHCLNKIRPRLDILF